MFILTFHTKYTIILPRGDNDLKKNCVICGKEFETLTNRKICYDKHTRICEICGEEFELKWPYDQTTCGKRECVSKFRQQVNKSKPKICEICGEEFYPNSPRQKYCKRPHIRKCEICGKEFNVDAHNVKSHTCGSQECKQKMREKTNIKRFGVPYVLRNPEILEKRENTRKQHKNSQ